MPWLIPTRAWRLLVFPTRPFSGSASREEARRALADDGIIAAIVERFDSLIGLWADDPKAQ